MAVYTVGAANEIAMAAVVLIITLITTVRQVLLASVLGIKATLSEILLRDGMCSFDSHILN